MKRIPYSPDDSDLQTYFVREVTNMEQLNHTCIIKLIGYTLYSQKDQSFIIYMPYMPNKSLIDVLREDESSDEKLLDPTRRSIIIYGIASGMNYIHKKEIIHRDLKPENIFMDEEFRPVISDFGFSRIYNEICMTNNLGSPFYMAPELFTDDHLTKKIDVYAFGVTLLQMFSPTLKLINRPPRDLAHFIARVKNGERYEIPNDVPEFYVDLIKKCWDQNPKNRPTFEEIVQLLESNDDFILPKSDVKTVKDFMDKLRNYPNSYSSTPYSGTCSQETQEFLF